jgi:hypothetical protein
MRFSNLSFVAIAYKSVVQIRNFDDNRRVTQHTLWTANVPTTNGGVELPRNVGRREHQHTVDVFADTFADGAAWGSVSIRLLFCDREINIKL